MTGTGDKSGGACAGRTGAATGPHQQPKLKLNWYPQRSCWRVRYRLPGGGKPRYKSGFFGKGAKGPDDAAAKARATLEAEQWAAEQHLEHRSQWGNYADETYKLFQERQRLAAEIASIEAKGQEGALSKTQAEQLIAPLMPQVESLDERIDLLTSSPLARLDELAELRTKASFAEELQHALEQSTETLHKTKLRNEELEAILAAAGQSAAVAVGQLEELAQAYLERTEAELKAKGKQRDFIGAFRTNVQLFVSWLPDDVTTTAELETSPQVLAEYRDHVIGELAEKTYGPGTAKKRLDKVRLFVAWLIERGYLSAMPRSIGKDWSRVGSDAPKPTFLTVKEIGMLLKAAPGEMRLWILLGLNCGYRESDIRTLERDHIDLHKRVITRQRSKTGKPQVSFLWPETVSALQAQLEAIDGTLPFAQGNSNLSRKLSKFMQGVLKDQEGAGVRTSKSLRSTGAQLVEEATGGNAPHVVDMYLGHADKKMAKHYRVEELEPLKKALKAVGKQLKLD